MSSKFRRLRIDQLRVAGETLPDLLARRRVSVAQLVDIRPQALHLRFGAFFRRRGQHIVEDAEQRIDLLLEVLVLAGELGERRVARHHARARGGKRLLHRSPPHRIGELQRLADHFGGHRRAREDADVTFHDIAHPGVAQRGDCRVVDITTTQCRDEDRHGLLEFRDRLGLLAGVPQTDGEEATRQGGAEMLLAIVRDVIGKQRPRGRYTGFPLADV